MEAPVSERRHGVPATSMIELCQLRESLSVWSNSLVTRWAILERVHRRMAALWECPGGCRSWLYLADALVDLDLHKQEPYIVADFFRKAFALLALHLAGALATMLAVARLLLRRGWQPSACPPLLCLVLSFAPEASHQVLARFSSSSPCARNLALLFHTLVLGGTCGALNGGVDAYDTFCVHGMVIMWQMSIFAASLMPQENATFPVFSPRLGALLCISVALASEWLGVLCASLLGPAVNWPAAFSAGAFSVVAACGFVCYLRRDLARANPDDAFTVSVVGTRGPMIACGLREFVLALKAAKESQLTYYLLVLLCSAVALGLVVCSRGAEPEVLNQDVPSHSTGIEVRVRAHLPLGIEVSASRYGLPRVDNIPPASPGSQTAVRVGDILVGVNGMPVTFRTWKAALRNNAGYCELRFRRLASGDGPSLEVRAQELGLFRLAAAGGA